MVVAHLVVVEVEAVDRYLCVMTKLFWDMKKYFVFAVLALATMPATAQETFENANIATGDLNGTARYVGMGGAMDALGGDISTINTNPAGIGIFRKSNISMSFGLVNQQDAQSFSNGNTTNASFDQLGFVWANKMDRDNYVNFAFNYHKSRNFNYILHAADKITDGAGMTAVTCLKGVDGILYPLRNDGSPDFTKNPSWECNQLDYVLMDLVWNGTNWGYYDTNSYTMDRSTKGYISTFDFNLSGNMNNRIFWGITVGVHDVDYQHYGVYHENLLGNDINVPLDYNLEIHDDRTITGTGADIKFGIIVRPIEESALRFGLSVSTPTWYDLKTRNNTYIKDFGGTFTNGDTYRSSTAPCENFSHEFKLYTPWKFNLSAGHTIGSNLAMGLGFEYADYSKLDTRYDVGGVWDNETESDEAMNRHTEKALRGVSTLKAGLEFKPAPELAVRFGYNYVSPMYKSYFKDGAVSSEGTSVASALDFTNWDATHRITCGLGCQLDNWNFALAYQYQTQKGKFEPFYYESLNDENLIAGADKITVKNQRHQLLFTVGYTF